MKSNTIFFMGLECPKVEVLCASGLRTSPVQSRVTVAQSDVKIRAMYLHAGSPDLGSISLSIAEGDQGTAQTIDAIRMLVRAGVRDAAVNRTALGILQGVSAHDTLAEAKAIYQWIRKNIRFTNDIYGAETLRPAREILSVRAGDCDCINGVLLPALLLSVGIPVRLVTINADKTRPEFFSHIYAEAEINGAWIPMDAASKNASFGAAPAVYWRKQVWEFDSENGGMGMYLGQDDDSGFDWTTLEQQLPSLIATSTAGAAAIVKASNVPTYPYAYPNSLLSTYRPATAVATVSASSSMSWILLLGGAALLIFLMRK